MGRASYSVSNTKKLTCIKVDLKDTERNGKFELKNFGKKITKPATLLADPNFKKRLGREGYMLESDYEIGAYAEYGLNPDRISGVTKTIRLEQENQELKERLAALEASNELGKLEIPTPEIPESVFTQEVNETPKKGRSKKEEIEG